MVRPNFPHWYSRLTVMFRLCFSLGIKKLVPAVPRKCLHPAHAPSTPIAIRPVIRHPTDLSQDIDPILVLTMSMILRRVIEGFTFVHLPDTHLLEVIPRTFGPTLTTTPLLTQQLGLV
jgi:hypothetical protein